MKFQFGQIVATPGALAALEQSGDGACKLLCRHGLLDAGELDAEDVESNRRALELGERILSSFKLRDGTKLWIITEADRSSTCLLLPEEY